VLTKEIPIQMGKGAIVKEGKDVCILAVGTMVATAAEAAENLEKIGVSAEVVSARFIKPIDEKLIISCAKKFKQLVTLEDNCKVGGFGSRVLEVINKSGLKTNLNIMALPEEFISHGSRNELLKNSRLDSDSVAKSILEYFARTKADFGG
jgi:1-deoxy-D-xylulose-5-phosphate synthase